MLAARTESLHKAVEKLIITKSTLNLEMQIICDVISKMYEVSSETVKDSKKLEHEIDSLPVLDDWIRMTTSDINQLKSQIIFLHKIMDED